MSTATTRSEGAKPDVTRKISSADRTMIYEIERWPSSIENNWLDQMGDARSVAIERSMDPGLVNLAARAGIARLVRGADDFKARMFERIRILVTQHEIPLSEVMREVEYRIGRIKTTFQLTDEQVHTAVAAGLRRYLDGGGSPEFAIGLADLVGVPEEKRSFLELPTDL